ncbi:MAG: hypothetical protein ACI4TP_07905 [Anaerotignum sp.]
MENLLIVPEPIYIILLLCGWIAALFSGIAFVYGIQMKKEKRTVASWGGVFALCLLLIFLLMNGMIASAG